MTTWPSIPGPWDKPAGDNVIGTLTRDDFKRGDDTVTHLVAPPPMLDDRDAAKPRKPVRTVVDNRSNPGLDVRDRSWLWGHYKWREVMAPKFNTGDVSGDGRAWILTADGCYEYMGLAVNGFPQWFLIGNKSARTNVGFYPWGEEWHPLPDGELGTTTGGLPDIALYRMTRGEPTDHALHCGLPADLLRLPEQSVPLPRWGDLGRVRPASFTDIHPVGHPQYDPDRGRQDGTPGVPYGARLRLSTDSSATVENQMILDWAETHYLSEKSEGSARLLAGVDLIEALAVIYALTDYGMYVTITTQPTVKPEGRMSIGIADGYLNIAERTALQAALQDAEWEVVVDG